MIVRKTKSPIAASIASSAIQRATTSDGVAAVSDRLGMTNCGAGPAFGPTANVNAPRTGCPSTEMTRQTTRYQPSGSSCTGTSSSFGFDSDRRGGPAVSCCAPASVTEMIANRGSTDSLKTSATCFGDVLTSTLAAGTVRSSTACDHATAGAASATATTAPARSARLIAPRA